MMLTVDIETDWGTEAVRGIEEALPRFLELLEQSGATATFFVVGELAPIVRRHVRPDGSHEVGSHGLTHRTLTRLPAVEVEREVRESKERLEEAGYAVYGFRAPFHRVPRSLPEILARCGYRYDASSGSEYPSLANRRAAVGRWPTRPPLARVSNATFRDGWTPFNLTWLRLLHPLAIRLVDPRAHHFSCHLHELIDGDGGWHRMPMLLRRIHSRNCGATAWSLLQRIMDLHESKFSSCIEFLTDGQAHRTPRRSRRRAGRSHGRLAPVAHGARRSRSRGRLPPRRRIGENDGARGPSLRPGPASLLHEERPDP